MILLILGVLLWSGAHLFKRLAPAQRDAMGDKGRGPIALAILASIILMIIGYRMADGAFYWGRHPATVGINNLLMFASLYLFAASGMKTAIARRMRHPMLTAVGLWAASHLLVNGDTASFVLFGGLLIWSVVAAQMINRAQPIWEKPAPAPRKKEFMAAGGTVIVYGVVVGIHYLLGYPTFG